MRKRTIYRDKKTGWFAKKSKWEKSHGKDGQYKREIIEYPPPPLPPIPGKLREWLVTREMTSKKRKRVLDFYVVATNRERALEIVLDRILRGRDDNNYDLTWARRITWDVEYVTEFEHEEEDEKDTSIERVEVH